MKSIIKIINVYIYNLYKIYKTNKNSLKFVKTRLVIIMCMREKYIYFA